MNYPKLPLETFTSFHNSSINDFKRCEFHFYLKHLLPQSSERSDSTDLVSGGAYAKGLEAMRIEYFYHEKPPEQAIDLGRSVLKEYYGDHIASKSNKTLERTVAGYDSYQKRWPLTTEQLIPHIFTEDDSHGIELEFFYPFPVINPATEYEVFYHGKLDYLGVKDGEFFIVDDKTPGTIKSSWGHKWALDSQFYGYYWALQKYEIDVSAVIIRGTVLLTKEIKHAQAVFTIRPEHLERWMTNTKLIISRILTAIERNQFVAKLNWECEHCQFLLFCMADHHIQQHLIEKATQHEHVT